MNTPFPTIHLNGTSGDELLTGYQAAYDAVDAAVAALAAVEFNARDYYVNTDPDAYAKARKERTRQLQRLREVQVYCEWHVCSLDEQIRRREEIRAGR